jgi:CHASE2 domain-containing sensor protein
MLKYGAWPWNRRNFSKILERAEVDRAKLLAFDIIFEEGSYSNSGDIEFSNRLRNSQIPVVLGSSGYLKSMSASMFSKFAKQVSVDVEADQTGAVHEVPHFQNIKGRQSAKIETMAHVLSTDHDVKKPLITKWQKVREIDIIDVHEFLNRPYGLWRGKTIIVGSATSILGDIKHGPNSEKVPGAIIQAISANGVDCD